MIAYLLLLVAMLVFGALGALAWTPGPPRPATLPAWWVDEDDHAARVVASLYAPRSARPALALLATQWHRPIGAGP